MSKGDMASNSLSSVCVYCGSSPGNDPDHLAAGRTLGRAIGEAGLRLVYGGGTKGIMGAVAEGAMDAGGKVTGIIPRFLMNKEATEKALGALDELIVTEDMHERKHRMFEESDAFVTLPGGIGTLEEVIEVMTWAQLGRHTKPIVLANINGFWNQLSTLLDHMREAGFIHTSHRVKPLIVDTAEEIIPAILDARVNGGGDEKIIERL
ncbi:TIGR00730 family Rossman fold protein [Oricola thermophila]|uniref:Cytokinin riboside 5'-monophosphate phosphoribohydrolase n=2 Tax=Oricola thermophila TaxID=2742145 RepID=A0A6N1VFR2_9HYPH|nr:TIGR00730 family Rossman fold protein [Oricola thermophila]QKV18445.1 TIGR00730 family Rossman fold protein [Oricola thermophila]